MNIITLSHGSGGERTDSLIKDTFIKIFNNPVLSQMNDSSILNLERGKIAFTTDSFVVKPIFFNGGDIGKLSVCGTINDLSMTGAVPIALSCGFIIEEGFELSDLKKIVESMKMICIEAGVDFVAGDTKVVSRGEIDKVFINTSGIGTIDENINICGSNAQTGDAIIVSGDIGEHEASILISRNSFDISANIKSDVAPLNGLVQEMLGVSKDIHVLRDPTRGGIATTLHEIAEQSKVEIEIYEKDIPISKEVQGVCSILGLDPLYFACEGKMLAFVPYNQAENILNVIRKHKYGKNASIIGRVKEEKEKGMVYMVTNSGGNRIISKLVGDTLPRIC